MKYRIELVENIIQTGEKVYFNPSKTAQNGINFITKDLIAEIIKASENDIVKDLFRLLNILNNEDMKNPDPIGGFFMNLASKGLTFSMDI
jgi:hypothetical protein